jgi:hypothetical protein
LASSLWGQVSNESVGPIDKLRGGPLHKTQDPLGHEQTARQDEPQAADEAVYEALYAALASTARGRAFLDEIARRARNADTLAALAALARIEAKLSDRLSDRLDDRLDDKAADQTDATHAAAAPLPAPAAMPEADEEPFAGIPSDEAYVPFELEEPDAPQPQPETVSAPPDTATARPSSADVLAQVMAMSPEERIALFS